MNPGITDETLQLARTANALAGGQEVLAGGTPAQVMAQAQIASKAAGMQLSSNFL